MNIPFAVDTFEGLMAEAGLDLAVLSTRHNLRYASGGYYYHFHANSQRMANSQYISFAGLPRGRLGESFYVMRPEERSQMEIEGPWFPKTYEALRGTLTAAAVLGKAIRELGLGEGRIGLELPFLPAEVWLALRRDFPKAELLDLTPLMNELRAVKRPAELAIIRGVYARTAEAIQAAFLSCERGISTARIEKLVAAEMAKREVSFLFALISAGPGLLRAPSASSTWEEGQVLHIDAGGHDRDYIADICRMGSMGPPSAQARELHAACLEVQDYVRGKIRAGVSCGEIVEAGESASKRYPFSRYARFVVHGIGMVPYENPVMERASTRPLEAGMVLSVETDFLQPGLGHVKIEDAVAVTEDGCEGLGDLGRDWRVI